MGIGIHLLNPYSFLKGVYFSYFIKAILIGKEQVYYKKYRKSITGLFCKAG